MDPYTLAWPVAGPGAAGPGLGEARPRAGIFVDHRGLWYRLPRTGCRLGCLTWAVSICGRGLQAAPMADARAPSMRLDCFRYEGGGGGSDQAPTPGGGVFDGTHANTQHLNPIRAQSP